MGINEIDESEVAQFPDGTREVLLTGSQGEVIGTAVVTFRGGQWAANLTMTAGAARNLGLNPTLIHTKFKDGETTLHLGVERS